jgi:arsenite-transporting ATPase
MIGLTSTLQGLFGNGAAADRAKTIDDAVSKLEEFQVKIMGLRRRLQDATQTSFVVVTIPTKSSVSESKRLMQELDAQGVAVTDVVVNQCASAVSGTFLVKWLGTSLFRRVSCCRKKNNADNQYCFLLYLGYVCMYADEEGASEVLAKFYERRRAGQQRWIREMQEAVERVSGAEEYQSNGDTGPIVVTEVPFFDVELIGVPALGYLGRESFNDSPAFSYLLKDEGKPAEQSSETENSKFNFC